MKRIITLTLILILSFIFNTYLLISQSVVVSEYYNDSQPGGEWTELLVVEDNVTLVGYVLRDNRQSVDEWQGGVRFKDVPLWKNIRRGTIIVIHHRYWPSEDDSKDDGYIELGAINPVYFDTLCYTCATADEWNFKALSIAAQKDIVQIIDSYGNHVHSLSHINPPSGDYLSLPNQKINYEGSFAGNKYSLYVVPGNLLSQYNSGSGTSNADTSSDVNFITLGFPNKSANWPNENQRLWRALRQPEWLPGKLQAFVNLNNITLKWENPIDDPAYESGDRTQGYMIIRYPASLIAGALPPEDGKTYTPGSSYGFGKIITNIQDSKVLTFTDNDNFKCGDSIYYRVYAYRYFDDDKNQDSKKENGRGRSYNENYAEALAIKRTPQKPEIISLSGKLEFCEGSTIELVVNASGGPFTYQWYRNNIILPGEFNDTLKTGNPGSYKVAITNELGCTITSDEVILSEIKHAKPKIYANGNEILQDTTIIVCEDESITLSVTGGESYEWYRDGSSDILSTELSYTPTISDRYYVIATNQPDCRGRTYHVEVKFITVDLSSDKSTLTFNIDNGELYKDQDIVLYNKTIHPLILEAKDIQLPTGFSIIFPPNPPYIVPALADLTLKIRFNPTKPGNINETMIINAPCDFKLQIELVGNKPISKLFSVSSYYNFGKFLYCNNNIQDTLVMIINSGADDIVILAPNLKQPFKAISPLFPDTVKASDTSILIIRFESNNAGNYSEILELPYFTKGFENITDTLKIEFTAKVVKPEFEIGTIDFNLKINDCDNYIDTSVVVSNPGNEDIRIYYQPVNELITLLNLPIVIEAGTTDTLRFRFQPKDTGDLNKAITCDINAQPCGLVQTITVIAQKGGLIYNLSNNGNIDFGNRIICNRPIMIMDSVVLNITGESSYEPLIKNIRYTGNLTGYISTNLSVGQKLLSNNIINIIFNNPAENNYDGNIILTIEPCDIELIVSVSATFSSMQYSLNSNQINFGDTYLFTTNTKSVSIFNNSKLPIIINSVENISTPFSLNSSNTAFPLTISPQSSLVLNIDYTPTVIGTDNNQIKLVISEPCPEELKIDLNGKGVILQQHKARANIPPLTVAKEGENVTIPVTINFENDTTIKQAGIFTIEIEIRFNPKILAPVKGELGNAALNHYGVGVDYEYEFDTPDLIKFIIDPLEADKIKSGEYLLFTAKPLVGDTNETELKLDLDIYSNEFVTVETNDGLVNIEYNCPPANRNISVGGIFGMFIKGRIPVTDDLEINIYTVAEEFTYLELYDNYGNKVDELLKGVIKPGLHTFILETSRLFTGVYNLTLRNGLLVKSIKIAVIK